MNKRLQQFLSAENISQSQFADSIGVAKASVSHILSGRNRPGYEFIQSLILRYPSLNIEWLMTGKGRMYKGKPADETPLFPDTPAQSAENFDSQEDNLFANATEVPDSQMSASEKSSTGKGRKISRIIIFFDDGTFKEVE